MHARFAPPSRARAQFLAALLSSVGLSGTVFTQAALAGPPEWLAKVVVQPGNSENIVLGYENRWGGLLVSGDSGAHFDMRCNWSVDTTQSIKWEGGAATPVFMVTAAGSVLVPTPTGLLEGDIRGCGFTQKTFNPGFAADAITPHPSEPNVVYAYAVPTSEGPGKGKPCAASENRRGLVRRNADGTATQLGKNDSIEVDFSGTKVCTSELLTRTLAATPSGGKVRIYEIGAKYAVGVAMQPNPLPVALRYTEDDGATFTEHALSTELAAIGVTPTILAVNPQNPAQLLIRFHQNGAQDSLFLSTDSGQTFSPVLAGEVTNVSTAAVEADGRIWLADRGQSSAPTLPAGLWTMASITDKPMRVTDTPMYCVGVDDKDLLGCTMYGFGDLDRATGAVKERFNIKETRAYVSCAGEDVATACAPQMCNSAGGESWCGPRHHATAPICEAFNSTSPCCGFPARDYDMRAESNDPSISNGLCRLVPTGDAGVGSVDAGVGPTVTPTSDAGSGGDPTGDAAVSADAGTAVEKPASSKSDDGCSVAPGSQPRPGFALLALGLLGLSYGLRRTRRRDAR
ncbi:MAG: hypothetical protein RL385_739 [Pseudomonadota bacterium]